MPTYNVPLTAVASVRQVVRITAENEEEAAAKAEKLLASPFLEHHHWKFNGLIYDVSHPAAKEFFKIEVMDDEVEEYEVPF